jgi:2-oxopent-4-enoate/cis-2-oxohex-4-enoate hydratase
MTTHRDELARTLQEAWRSRTPCAPLSADHPEMTVDDAYAVQAVNIAKRIERGLHGRPARLVGRKIGITSKAVQDWLGVPEPDFGCLLDDMAVDDGGEADTGLLLQPRVEGEIAFVLKSALVGPGVTAADVLRATDFVLPAIEIIDSRVADWKIKYEDTIADNASSGLYVLGSTPRKLDGLDLELCGMALRKNGAVVSSGAGAACLGHPVNAVVWLANKLGELGATLGAGQVVLSGALGPVSPVEKGDAIDLEIARLGRCSVRFG